MMHSPLLFYDNFNRHLSGVCVGGFRMRGLYRGKNQLATLRLI